MCTDTRANTSPHTPHPHTPVCLNLVCCNFTCERERKEKTRQELGNVQAGRLSPQVRVPVGGPALPPVWNSPRCQRSHYTTFHSFRPSPLAMETLVQLGVCSLSQGLGSQRRLMLVIWQSRAEAQGGIFESPMGTRYSQSVWNCG